MSKKLKILFVMFISIGFLTSVVSADTITVTNPSFESGTTGWSGATTSNSEFYSPVDGTNFATRSGGSGYTTQLTGHTIAAGETFSLTVWARSTNSQGTYDATNAEARLYYGSTTINAVTQDVNPVRLSGAPDSYTNDDGANVWIDQGYRMEFADNVFYQLESADPLYDSWTYYNDSDYDTDMANGQIITSQGFKGLFSTFYEDSPPYYSSIWLKSPTGSPPNYSWPAEPESIVLEHSGDEDPWVIDAHLFQDPATGKLWMSWGGLPLRVSEMDPSDGELIGHPSSPEYDTHPSGYHTAVADWNGDEWSSDWAEGPALFKHNGYWYFFGSYGNLSANYTIRGGRGTSPTGPYYDKDGVNLMTYDSGESEYGNTIFLGHDGGQTNPGHPHIWEESGVFYMGYDYVEEYSGGNGSDTMGIRLLYWVNDWPTIWTPITVTFDADDYPAAIGQTLGISLRNTGSGSTGAAFDLVALDYTPGAPDTDPPTPDPMTWASVPTADDQDSISMTATTATDVSGVEYYFDETTGGPGGSDSGWQDSTSYTDAGLNAGTQYCYEVAARDKSTNQNETAASSNQCATTDAPDTTPPTPDPMTWATVPYATGSDSIAMVATTATDPSGVQYYFDEISGNPGGSDSGWQGSASYTDTGLSPSTQYTYTVTARDVSANYNETAASTDESATTESGPLSAEDFEVGFGDWVNVTGDQDDWYRNQGSTPSSSTGPDHDNTIGDATGWYIHMETSSGYANTAGDEVHLEGPDLDATTYSMDLSFYYHMYGSDIGTLNVDVYDGTWNNAVWSISGQQHASSSVAYTQAIVDLDAYTGTIKIRFRGVAAGSYRGDMAIDDIEVTGAPRAPDTDPPTPDPMTWATVPYSTGTSSIAMVATTASDASGVEYNFDETSGNPGGSDSGWQDSTSYTDTGLNAATQYCYEVAARDKSVNQNETAASSNQCATTDAPDTTPPTPDPMTWASVPSADSDSAISMTATTATDPSGVQYYFDEITGGPGSTDSGWQSSTSYTDTGLNASTQYTYTVTARDVSPNYNETAASTSESATTEATPPIHTYNFEGITQADTDYNAYACDVDTFPFAGSSGNRNSQVEATDSQYVNISADNTAQWATADPSWGDEILLWVEMKITEAAANITQIDLTFNGNTDGSAATTHRIYVMKAGTDWTQSASWIQVGTSLDIAPDVDTQMTRSITSGFSDYIDASGNIIWGVYETRSSEDMRINYLEMVVTTGGAPDTTPPTPDPMTWATTPYSTGENSIAMVATTASDASGVEYYFYETSGNPGGSDSGWQDSTSYTDSGLNAGTQYCYEIQARDKSINQNATAWSTNQCATTDTPDTTPPTPDPMTWASVPAAGGTDNISMTATTATDPSGVQYYFDETSGNPGGSDSGWQASSSYTDTGLSASTQYTYTVTARDQSVNLNETAASTAESATTDDAPACPGGIYTDYIGAGQDTDVVATASGVDDQAIPQNTVNGSGLSGGTHSTNWSEHWLHWGTPPSPAASPNPARGNGFWIHYDLGYQYSLGDMWVWNYNEGSYTNRGFNNVVIDYSDDGSTWVELGSSQFSQASGSSSYAGFGGPDFGGVCARYVLITANSNWGASDGYGLAEIQINISAAGPDTDPPTPNPATFASAPSADSDTAISMTATTGSDASGPVEYFFDETSGGPGATDSGWQTSASYTDTGLTASTQYTYTVQMRDSIPNTGTASSPANATTDPPPDTTPPTPDPMTWQSVPSAGSDSAVSMTATTASDPSGVEYYFYETSANPGGSDSGWQDPASYTDTGLTSETQYCYEVQARDKSANQNATGWSSNQCATTQATPDTTPPTPDPMTWNSAPAAGGTDNISMTASTASDPSGVEYNFDETSGNPGGTDSGWQDSVNYTDTGLNDSTQYCYRVQARDKSVNQNATAYSTTECATTDAIPDTDPPTPNPATWSSVPSADSSSAISMTATTGSDPSGVQYSFDETSGNPGGSDSGWQSSSSYTDSGLDADTQYTYRVQMRDQSANQNTGSWSTSESATTDPVSDWTQIIYDNFEGGFGNWNDGGADCKLYTGGTYAHQGSNALDLEDNTSSSVATTANLALAGYAEVKVDFWYICISMDNSNEDFWLQISTNGGSSFDTVEEWNLNDEFVNGTFYPDSVIITGYTLNNTTQLRFRCDASGGADDVYIDEILVSASGEPVPDTDPPTPNPATWASVPSADSSSAISMTATTGSDPSGVQYSFDETSGNPGGSDSGWQSSASYTDSGLSASTQYCYRVRMRDQSANQNTGSWSTTECATTQAGGTWTMVDDRDASVTYTGTWQNNDPSQAYMGTTKWSYPNGTGFEFAFTGTGVRYYNFDCDAGNVALYIDGDYQTTISSSGSCNASVLKYENTSLSSGPHTLSGTVTSGETEVDAFAYFN